MITRPLIILGAPRSGTTMIFQALSTHPELWSLYRESQCILNRHFPTEMVPGNSVLVTAEDVDDATAAAIDQEFFEEVGNAEASLKLFGRGVPIPLIARARLSALLTKLGKDQKVPPMRMVEKTPDNCFRIQMLLRVFPDAQFVVVVRDPRGSIASIHKGWTQESRFQRFPLASRLLDQGLLRQLLVFRSSTGVGGPRRLHGDGDLRSPVAALQRVLRALTYPKDDSRVLQVRYEEMASDPGPVLRQVAAFADLDPQPLERYGEKLPVVNTWTKPSSDKWKRVEEQITAVLPLVAAESDGSATPREPPR